MKRILSLLLAGSGLGVHLPLPAGAQTTPAAAAPVAAAPANPAPPPAAPAALSAAEMEKLVAPIALYPDALIATILPASVYPLEIVQAARFVADTNNLAKIDAQPWDDSVKALARVPDALKKLNDDLPWTMQLGETFLAQDKDVMDTIQRLRLKAQKAGMLQTSEQQIVVVTNTVVETVVQQQPVVVTNTIVQIVPANPQVIYVPQYNPVYVYAPPPTYVVNPVDPFLTFAAGVAVGAIIANNCDWHHGGCYYGGGSYNGGGNTKIKIEGDVNIGSGNNNINSGNRPTQNAGQGQKWKPDQSRLNKSGAAGTTSARSQEARGWGAGGAKPSTGSVGARPATGTAGARPSAGAAPAARPSAGAAPAARPATGSAATRPSTAAAPAARPSSGSAFGGASSGSAARSSSVRGNASRSSGGFGGASRSGGGVSRGGGGGGRR